MATKLFNNLKDRVQKHLQAVQEQNKQDDIDSFNILSNLSSAIDANTQAIKAIKEPSTPPFLNNFQNEMARKEQEQKDNLEKLEKLSEETKKAATDAELDVDNKNKTTTTATDGKTEQVQPIRKIVPREKIKTLSSTIKNRVFGQDDVTDEVIDVLKVAALNLKINKKKPAGCYFFAGPSGVGKSELAFALGEALDVPILKINAGEYSQEHEVTKLIGAPAGYVGSKEDGVLTGFVKNNPVCIILVDEYEKADPAIDKIFLSIMDHGECGTNKGDTVSFTNTIVIATSNLGAEVEYREGLSKEEKNEIRMEYIKQGMRPEIVNRYDSIFHFNSLSPDIYKKVVVKFISSFTKSVKEEQNFILNPSEKLISWIAEKSYDPAMGGRPARKFIEKIATKPLIDFMLDDDFLDIIDDIKLDPQVEKETVGADGQVTKEMIDAPAKGELIIDVNEKGLVTISKKVGKSKPKLLKTLENTLELVAKLEEGKFIKSKPTSTEIPTIESKNVEPITILNDSTPKKTRKKASVK